MSGYLESCMVSRSLATSCVAVSQNTADHRLGYESDF